MTDEKIARINELARLSKQRALTEDEAQEQAVLRREYIDGIKHNVHNHLSNIHIQNEDGSIQPLKRKDEN
ncbi:DUF896 domain-containing protein [Eubacteriales bacterium OttesenSCG-928-N14]|nr:DUF896 domain-containing protein [Eubacteriales bacterium OttesenSCG-928-N14]